MQFKVNKSVNKNLNCLHVLILTMYLSHIFILFPTSFQILTSRYSEREREVTMGCLFN